MNIIPMRDLKDTVSIEKLCQESNAPIFVTKNGYGKLVIMDIDYYEKVLGKLYEAKIVNDALAEVDAGKVIPGESVKQRIAKKHGFKV